LGEFRRQAQRNSETLEDFKGIVGDQIRVEEDICYCKRATDDTDSVHVLSRIMKNEMENENILDNHEHSLAISAEGEAQSVIIRNCDDVRDSLQDVARYTQSSPRFCIEKFH